MTKRLVPSVSLAVAVLLGGTALAEPQAPPGGAAILTAVAEAYRSAPAFTDEIGIVVNRGGRNQQDRLSVAFAGDGLARIESQGHVYTRVNETVYVHRPKLPTKFVKLASRGTITSTLKDFVSIPAPQILLRSATTEAARVEAFGLGIVEGLELIHHEIIAAGDGITHELGFTASVVTRTGILPVTITASADDATKLIRSVVLEAGQVTFTLTMNPTVHDADATGLVFTPPPGRQVATIGELALGVGDPAPDFTLTTLNGTKVTLQELRGNVVVLDFWATWCPPCKMSLPLLQQVETWATTNDVKVKVFAVDTGERVRTRDQKHKKVLAYWKGKGFTMDTLMDYDFDTAVRFEVGPIPHTVVIGPDGTLVEVRVGFDPDMVQHLKSVTMRALDQKG